jgi:hypothetical protein
MKNLLIASLVLVACGPLPENVRCVTTCGMQFTGWTDTHEMPEGWTCDDVQAGEDRALEFLAPVAEFDSRFENVCKAIDGWELRAHNASSWDFFGTDAMGATPCPAALIEINWDLPSQGPLMHEIAHAVQGCIPWAHNDDITDGEDSVHKGWKRLGIRAAERVWWEGIYDDI